MYKDVSNDVTVFYDKNLNLGNKIRISGNAMIFFLFVYSFLHFSFWGLIILNVIQLFAFNF